MRRLLVANRGEIARRILRSAHARGVQTAVVHASPERAEPFVLEADAAVPLPGATAAETYLDAPALLDAAIAVGADAVHPGYGFLAEDPAFAEAVLAAGLTWVGPPPPVMATMADKLAGKKAAAAAGLAHLPSAEITGDDPAAWLDAVTRAALGWPVVVKAAAGGGGRGMRTVAAAADLADAVLAARREASASFGDPRVFAEPARRGVRHVEVQVLADGHGHVVHLGERDCSVQRRFQKLLEEAPAPGLSASLREAMADAAVALARSLGYVGVGTVEFLLEGSGPEAAFWFSEMNTRLQVEHPVTEEVWGVDLVDAQLAVAAGEPLPFTQGDLAPRGHAFEARLVAEDPLAGWLPAGGTVRCWRPATTTAARWDSAVEDGSVVSPHFDSLVAKAIVHAPTRPAAAARLARALRQLACHGITTNREVLVALLEDQARGAAFPDTSRLDGADLVELVEAGAPTPEDRNLQAVCAAMSLLRRRRGTDRRWGPAPARWSNVERPPGSQRLRRLEDGAELSVGYRPLARDDRSFSVTVRPAVDAEADDGQEGGVDLGEVLIEELAGATGTARSLRATVGGVTTTATVRHDDDQLWVNTATGQRGFAVVDRLPPARRRAAAGRDPVAPVPGRVAAVQVATGDRVAVGQALVVLEAMKVEHRIVSPVDGVAVAVLVGPGDIVEAHQPLVRIEEDR